MSDEKIIIALKVAWDGKEVWGKLQWADENEAVYLEVSGQSLVVPAECIVDEMFCDIKE